ncbi:hypothetical protein K461DRAFT_298124 [Myriangium duriaei CBS 260.36]|uniref:Uncharacterized protein n=1 Tax=Myriangium duriaei CBS 260.36 TaxID=1168546 RepID=A0A9P4MFK5_9PEZI|nr:hypothetical protein K461DRAFT_298124 [Myriangium duriaei CBS 260.36]
MEIAAATYSGTVADDHLPPHAQCSVGECTWPPTPSLAICGACERSNFAIDTCSENSCNYTLASGLMVLLGTNAAYENSLIPGFQAVSSPDGHIFNHTFFNRLFIAHFELFGVPYHPSVTFNASSAINTECALWFCMNVYNASVESNEYHEAILSSFHDLDPPLTDDRIRSEFHFSSLPSSLDADNQTHFTVQGDSFSDMLDFIGNFFEGTASLWKGDKGAWVRGYDSALVLGMWKGSEDPEGWITGLAGSLSNTVRSMNPISRSQYQGTSYELSIVIRWTWLVFPIALILSTFVLLVLVILRTASSQVASWKGDPLALLLFEVDERTKHVAGYGIGNAQGILKSIGNKTVTMTQGNGGLIKFKAC